MYPFGFGFGIEVFSGIVCSSVQTGTIAGIAFFLLESPTHAKLFMM